MTKGPRIRRPRAAALTGLLPAATCYPAGSRVLEAGFGTGAQTVILAAHSPQADFTCIDVFTAISSGGGAAGAAILLRQRDLSPEDAQPGQIR